MQVGYVTDGRCFSLRVSSDLTVILYMHGMQALK